MNRTFLIASLVALVAIAVGGSVYSPEHTVQILGFSSISVGTLITILQAKQVEVKVAEVAVKAEAAATGASEQMDSLTGVVRETQKTGEAVHSLVNSAMSSQLKLTAVTMRRLASKTKTAEDKKAAEEAERLSKEHDERQAKVDASPVGDAK